MPTEISLETPHIYRDYGPIKVRRGGTIAVATIEGIRERHESEPVHYRKRLGQTRCLHCWQKIAGVWSTNSERPRSC